MGSLQDNPINEVAVVMVPFPAQGHLNQLMQLSCLIVSRYDIPAYYTGSAVHNRQARARVNGLNPLDVAKIRFHDVPTPDFASPAPNPDSPEKFPAQLLPSWDAALCQRQHMAAFFEQISAKARRLVVVHDPLMAFVVQDFVSLPNAESYVFNCISAFTQAALTWRQLGRLFPIELPKELPASVDEIVPEEVSALVALQQEPLKNKSGDIHNTCRLIEGSYLEMLASEDIAGGRKTWAIGPILPTKLPSTTQNPDSPQKCLLWLDEQEPNSVIYVSFGSTTTLSDEEIRELAMGLEQSKQKFIWVLREADRGDIFSSEGRRAELPEGMEERVEGVGIIVRDWAPQPEILAHPSTGGFMSHCGWNSCIESLTMGVPIAAWPMHSDQPRNAYLITEILKVGIPVKEWNGEKGVIVRASSVENVVKRLMASDEGAEIRRRAEELCEGIRRATEEGGVSRLEMDSFIAHITR